MSKRLLFRAYLRKKYVKNKQHPVVTAGIVLNFVTYQWKSSDLAYKDVLSFRPNLIKSFIKILKVPYFNIVRLLEEEQRQQQKWRKRYNPNKYSAEHYICQWLLSSARELSTLKNGILVIKWKDNQKMFWHRYVQNLIRGRPSSKLNVNICCPISVKSYNASMWGVEIRVQKM